MTKVIWLLAPNGKCKHAFDATQPSNSFCGMICFLPNYRALQKSCHNKLYNPPDNLPECKMCLVRMGKLKMNDLRGIKIEKQHDADDRRFEYCGPSWRDR